MRSLLERRRQFPARAGKFPFEAAKFPVTTTCADRLTASACASMREAVIIIGPIKPLKEWHR